MEYRIVSAPPAFVSTKEIGADKLAATWLAENTTDGFEPHQLFATGNAARLTLSGCPEQWQPVVFIRRTAAPPKAKSK